MRFLTHHHAPLALAPALVGAAFLAGVIYGTPTKPSEPQALAPADLSAPRLTADGGQIVLLGRGCVGEANGLAIGYEEDDPVFNSCAAIDPYYIAPRGSR